jgi:carbon monoxide dehydrogenase subunit G
MLNNREQRPVRFTPAVLSLAVGLGVIGTIAAGATSVEAASDGVSCEVQIKTGSGSVSLEGIVRSDTSIDGTYQLVVTRSGGSGGSNIDQGGEFSAAAGEDTSLGTVMLSGIGGTYVAKLKVKWNGSSTVCREKVSGSL